jgi:hypothetical protein
MSCAYEWATSFSSDRNAWGTSTSGKLDCATQTDRHRRNKRQSRQVLAHTLAYKDGVYTENSRPDPGNMLKDNVRTSLTLAFADPAHAKR